MSDEIYLIGRVHDIDSKHAYVTLLRPASDERWTSRADTKQLATYGITKIDQEFEVRINGTVMKITPLKPKPISEEDVRRIRDMFSNRWPDL